MGVNSDMNYKKDLYKKGCWRLGESEDMVGLSMWVLGIMMEGDSSSTEQESMAGASSGRPSFHCRYWLVHFVPGFLTWYQSKLSSRLRCHLALAIYLVPIFACG